MQGLFAILIGAKKGGTGSYLALATNKMLRGKMPPAAFCFEYPKDLGAWINPPGAALCYALLGRHAEYDSRYGEADGKEHRNQAHDQPEG